MSPRRAVAVLLTLVVVASAVAYSGSADSSRADLLEPRSAHSAALALVERYPDYFLALEQDAYSEWEATLEVQERELLRRLTDALFRQWVLSQRFDDGASLQSSLKQRVERVREQFVSGHEMQFPDDATFLDASLHHPAFPRGNLSRLARGLSNCEGENLTLAALLAERWAAMPTDHDGHVMVVLVEVPGGPVFVDAYTNLPPFQLRGAQTGVRLPSYEDVAEKLPQGSRGRPLEIAPRSYFEGVPQMARQARLTGTDVKEVLNAGLEALRTLEPRQPSRALPPLWREYLRARVAHLFLGKQAGEGAYSELEAQHCLGAPTNVWICTAVSVYLRDLRSKQ